MLSSPNRLLAAALVAGFAAYAVVALVTARWALAGLLVLVAAALLLGALRAIPVARAINVAAGTLWLLLGIAGLFLIGTPANLLGWVAFDEVLMFAAATVLLAVGLGARRDGAPTLDDVSPPAAAPEAPANPHGPVP